MRLCTIDLNVFEAMKFEAKKSVAKNPAIGFVLDSSFHFCFECV